MTLDEALEDAARYSSWQEAYDNGQRLARPIDRAQLAAVTLAAEVRRLREAKTLLANVGRAYVAWLANPTKKARDPLAAALAELHQCQDETTACLPQPFAPRPRGSAMRARISTSDSASLSTSPASSRTSTPDTFSEFCAIATSPVDPQPTRAHARRAVENTSR